MIRHKYCFTTLNGGSKEEKGRESLFCGRELIATPTSTVILFPLEASLTHLDVNEGSNIDYDNK